MTLTMTVDRSGASPYARFDWPAASRAWGREAAPLGQSMLRAQAPMLTGKLRQSISVREEAAAGSYMIMFYTTVPYARFVLEGTRPHVITVRNAKALRWTANRGHGPVRFARSVQHPGTKPDPFPEKAMERISPAVARLFAEACREAAEL